LIGNMTNLVVHGTSRTRKYVSFVLLTFGWYIHWIVTSIYDSENLFLFYFGLKRDTIQAATSFALRNQLPPRLQDQMISHLSLKFRTDSEGLQQQETLDALPKAIRSSISHYLFLHLVQNIYLFQGVSNDLIFQLVRQWWLFSLYFS
jgi:hypothetical protein